ncbi:hypothetical protein TNCV_2281031 [Trichonephila clavipes]|nr:hypothetical protein TNCV_2281031 [Trichonephila clavipes]
MGYARETNCSPFALTKLGYRTEESSPRSLEPFEPTTHSSSHSKYADTGRPIGGRNVHCYPHRNGKKVTRGK